MTLVRRALKVLADREVSPQLGVLKSTLLQLDPTFSEREYGVSTFRDFVQRLARAGYVVLKGTDRNIYVELREGADGAPLHGAPVDPRRRWGCAIGRRWGRTGRRGDDERAGGCRRARSAPAAAPATAAATDAATATIETPVAGPSDRGLTTRHPRRTSPAVRPTAIA